jgi:hypothetical protein
MMPIIIFATIVINGEVENWQYYKVRQGFATEKDCYEYMEKNGKTVRKELETRMQAKNPNSRLLVLGCSDRKTFAEE